MDYAQLIERLNTVPVGHAGLLTQASNVIEALQARVKELESLNDLAVKQAETLVKLRDAALAKLKELEAQEPAIQDGYEAATQEIVQRYRVEKTRGGFWPCCVKAGDGTMDIFVGSQKQAEHVRQALQTACLDGAFMATRARPIPAQPTARAYMDGYSDCKQWAMEQAQPEPHSDDIAVDAMAAAMKEKLAQAREKGRGGWETCSQQDLSRLLREHVEKGDPRDVANFCAFLHALGLGIAQPEPVEQPSCDWTQSPDFDMGDTYSSSCGELWSFIDGGPTENRVKYCHNCGKPVKLAEDKGGA